MKLAGGTAFLRSRRYNWNCHINPAAISEELATDDIKPLLPDPDKTHTRPEVVDIANRGIGCGARAAGCAPNTVGHFQICVTGWCYLAPEPHCRSHRWLPHSA